MKDANVVFKAAGKVLPIKLTSISAECTLQEAAALMRDSHCSVLRVGENGKMENIISAYDIVTNAVARNKMAARTKVRDIMNGSLLPDHIADPAPIPMKVIHTKAGNSRKPGRLAFASGIKN
jgi:predicted transcriptional regulator